jgi:hypothetical protein
MSSNVVEFRRPERWVEPPAKRPRVSIEAARRVNRGAWKAAVRAFWDDPANWRTSRRGDPCIVIDECGVCVVIEHGDEGYWSWVIRWRDRDGREMVRSKWIYVNEEGAFVSALDAVIALA